MSPTFQSHLNLCIVVSTLYCSQSTAELRAAKFALQVGSSGVGVIAQTVSSPPLQQSEVGSSKGRAADPILLVVKGIPGLPLMVFCAVGTL